MGLRMGIDVGGTFTDFILLDPATGRIDFHKQPSVPSDPAAAITGGIDALIAAGVLDPADLDLVVHGTTIALNAVLQRRGAALGLFVSAGNEDILEIARVRMADSYGFFALPERPLVSRDAVVGLPARLGVDGSVVRAPTEAELDRAAAAMAGKAVDSVAVALLHAPANPAFEAEIAAALGRRLTVPVTASTQLWAETREYERTTIAAMNGFVGPIMRNYYDRLRENLAARSIAAPVSITTSNGGSVDIDTAYHRPIDSMLSGPASGVVAAIETRRRAGVDHIITFDMGGTSADIAIVEGDVAEMTTRTMIGELPLILPVVAVGAIGAGGGSIVRVDETGFLKVGPASAGAVPGPACFGKGGEAATTTDCYLACGFLDPANFAGGALPLYPERSERALAGLADALGFTGEDGVPRVAAAALKVASSMMATEVRKALARRGSDPADFALLPYGGAGPTHAALLAEEAGIDRILVAARPGTFCAFGAAVADLRRDFVRSVSLLLAGAEDDARQSLSATLDELAALAADWTATLGDRAERWSFTVTADLRYPDQAFDLALRLPGFVPGGDVADQLVEGFHAEHLRLYGFNEPANRVEVRRVVMSAIGHLATVSAGSVAAFASMGSTTRRVWFDGGWTEATVIAREAIGDGVVDGPAIIEQADTTIVVPPGWSAAPAAGGSLMIERTGPSA